MEEKIFNWCFIGTGALANKVAKQITKSKRHKIVSCYSRNIEKAKAFAKKYKAKAYEDIESAILDKNVDGVYIVTPHNTHYRFAKTSLSLGKPTLVEKPFTINSNETKELISLANEKNIYLCEAMWTFFSFSANQTIDLIKSNSLGKLKQASFNIHMKINKSSKRVFDPKRAGGALLDIGIYPICYAYRLFGKPQEIELKEKRIQNGIDLGEELIFHYENNFNVNISVAIDNLKGFEKAKIEGDEGKILIPFFHSSNRLYFKNNFFYKAFYKRNSFSYLNEFDKVSKEIKDGLIESKYVSHSETYEVMNLLDEIRDKMSLKYENLE